MKLRRLLALLTSVTMLHLSVAPSDAACATHSLQPHPMSTSSGAMTALAIAMAGHAMPMSV